MSIRFGPAFAIVVATAGLLPAAARATPPFAFQNLGLVRQEVVSCRVSREGLAKNCTTELPPGYDKPFVRWLKAHPPRLSGARSGERVLVLVRQGLDTERPPIPAEQVVTEPDILEVQRNYYPKAAVVAKVEARTRVSGRIANDGRLDDCWTRQDPSDQAFGFGEATLLMMRLVRVVAPLPQDRQWSYEAVWRPPGPAPFVIVTCGISAQLTTEDCETDLDEAHPGAAELLLRQLHERPLHLSLATPGQRLKIALYRAEIGGSSRQVVRPANPAPDYKPKTHWRSVADVERYYPDRAARMEVEGLAKIRCKVLDDGRLNECWVRTERPLDMDFGVAALRLSKFMRAEIPGPAAAPYEYREADFPINFRLPQ